MLNSTLLHVSTRSQSSKKARTKKKVCDVCSSECAHVYVYAVMCVCVMHPSDRVLSKIMFLVCTA